MNTLLNIFNIFQALHFAPGTGHFESLLSTPPRLSWALHRVMAGLLYFLNSKKTWCLSFHVYHHEGNMLIIFSVFSKALKMISGNRRRAKEILLQFWNSQELHIWSAPWALVVSFRLQISSYWIFFLLGASIRSLAWSFQNHMRKSTFHASSRRGSQVWCGGSTFLLNGHPWKVSLNCQTIPKTSAADGGDALHTISDYVTTSLTSLWKQLEICYFRHKNTDAMASVQFRYRSLPFWLSRLLWNALLRSPEQHQTALSRALSTWSLHDCQVPLRKHSL